MLVVFSLKMHLLYQWSKYNEFRGCRSFLFSSMCKTLLPNLAKSCTPGQCGLNFWLQYNVGGGRSKDPRSPFGNGLDVGLGHQLRNAKYFHIQQEMYSI